MPDAPDAPAPLPWRAFVVGTGALYGAVIASSLAGGKGLVYLSQLPYVLGSLGMAAVAFLASHWLRTGVVDVALWLAWFLMPERHDGWRERVRHFVAFANRQVGHLEAALAWTLAMLALMSYVGNLAQLWPPLIIAGLAFGAPLLDRLVLRLHLHEKLRGPEDDQMWARRPLFYLVTAVGMTVLAVAGRAQLQEILFLWVVVGVGLLMRTARWAWLTYLTWRGREATEADRKLAARMRELSRFDRHVAWAAAIAILYPYLDLARIQVRGYHDDAERRALRTNCGFRGDGPTQAQVSLFIIADNQFHEMDGARDGIQLDMVDAIVPVAVRPVPLDLLSGVTLAHFGDLYKSLAPQVSRFTHLGDIGDLGCMSELERFKNLILPRYGAGLVALAAGNHDSAFTGNFAWHPAWQRACAPSRPAYKVESNELLFAAVPDRSAVLGRIVEHPLSASAQVHKSALTWLARLGEVDGQPVLGAFFDTSDFTGATLGIAGEQGAISGEQARFLADQLALHRDAWIVLFLHHPFDEINADSRARVEQIADGLDRRLVALVSAHTHLAAYRHQQLAGRDVPELVVGSTTDPPQEAALLELGPGHAGGLAVRLRTIPAVSRGAAICPGPETALNVTAEQCRASLAAAKRQERCAPLYQSWGAAAPSLSGPAKVRADQEREANQLLDCICRDGGCEQRPADPFDARVFPMIDGLYDRGAAKRTELICLSWAASIWQGNKKEAHGLDPLQAFEPDTPSAYGALEINFDVR
jgi:hypothetical protein